MAAGRVALAVLHDATAGTPIAGGEETVCPHSRCKGDWSATELREKIRVFQAGSLEHKPLATPEVP
ncbi:hypothetical protein [Actinomadura xylanilytica]|uniref:hypothetical protein n=1 Tax=Actinomadura xylanilytica TaxID=887459 RepID=UPI00255AB303|nr:hypothetical protein [Actinomadura xylanilytica]MDL4774145.1 hypothetical protein [Actinomadura xylanilytica]